MIRVIEETDVHRFETACNRAFDEGYKLSSSHCSYSHVGGLMKNSTIYLAIFYKDPQIDIEKFNESLKKWGL